MSKLVAAGALALALLLGIGGAARAEPEAPAATEQTASTTTPTASKLNEEGFALYKQRDYRRAAEKFLQTYALEPDPNLLFNIARCYDALGDASAAIEKYEAFLAKPDADPQGKKRAEKALQALRQGKPSSALSASTLPPSLASSPDGEAGGADLAAAPKRPFGVLPFVALGAGVAVTAVGAIFYVLGVQDHDKVTGAPGYGNPTQVDPMTERAARALVDSGNTKKTVGAVGLVIGGAALVGSAVLFVLDTPGGGANNEQNKDHRGLAFGFTPDAGGGRVVLGGAF